MKIIKGKFCMPCRMLSQWLEENHIDIPEEFADDNPDVEKYGIKQTPALIPDSINVDFTIGEIVSVDTGYYENGMYVTNQFSVGNIIAFPKVAGTKVTLDGEKLTRVMVNDIVAVQREGE